MKRYHGGDQVKPGGYWSYTNGRYARVAAEGGTLPGANETAYLRAPLPLVMVLSPVIGLSFVIFLPFIGLAMGLYLVARGLRVVVEQLVEGTLKVAAPNWAPGRAYFARRRAARQKPKK